MNGYRKALHYIVADLSQEAMDRAMTRGRYLRSKAFHEMAAGLVDWLTKPRRPAVDMKSHRNGTTVRPQFTG